MVVDCIFGTGFRAERALPDECKAVFKQVDYIRRTYRTPVVAVDIPSGVDADTALVAEGALQATHTVTFVAPKPGLLGYPGRKFAGEIAVRGLGIPESFAAAVFQNSGLQGTYAITEADLRAWRPERPADGHKGLFGRALLLAGNTGMMGAGVMAAEACLQSGTGLVTWAVPEDVYPIAATFCPQALVTPLPNDFSNRVVACKELIFNKQAVLIGPGCGTDELTVLSLEQAIRNAARLVIDADGLNCLAKDPDLQAEVAARRARLLEPAVLTPHPGEFVRLIPEQAGFPDGRVAAAEALAERLNCVVVLKGAGTVVALPSILETKERFWVNITGNSGLSKGGSGDVLAGLMTGLLAQNLPLGVAVCGAVYLHGLAGDQLKETCGERALRPTDLPAALAGAFAACGW
jgi:NAD(P)H-hydrate epimerase